MAVSTTGEENAPTAGGPSQRRSGGPGAQGAGWARSGELLAVIGPIGSTRMSLLLALGSRLRSPGERHGARRRVALVRVSIPPDPEAVVRTPGAVGDAMGDGSGEETSYVPWHTVQAPDPYARVGELLRRAGPLGQQSKHRASAGRALAAVGLTTDGPRGGSGRREGVLSLQARFADLPPADRLLFAVALALAAEPAAVLVDSADDGLDAVGRHRVWSRLRRLADFGVTVVAACDSAETAGVHAHRTVLLPHRSGDGGAGAEQGHHG